MTLVALLALPSVARAQESYPPGPFAPWDGSNPFDCELQEVGFGVDFPDPAADPFCVKFDKTQQNVTELGIVDFLVNEPTRVANASGKCFYYQRDHWTGSVIQGQPPELWNWVGSYFFDRALAVGGVNIQQFRILGQPASPSDYLDLPPEFAPYFDQDGGGAYVVIDVPADPVCAARVDTPEESDEVYGPGGPPPTPGGGLGTSVVVRKGFQKAKRGKRCKRGGGVEAGTAKKKKGKGKKRRCGKKRGKKRGKRKR